VVGFTKEEIIQRLRVFTGDLSDGVVKERLKLEDTGSWKLSEARQKIRKKELEKEIRPFAYRPFDVRWICYEPALIDSPRLPFMKHLLKENLSLVITRILAKTPFTHAFISDCISDICLLSTKTKETAYFFPLYLYSNKGKREVNFKEEFLKAVKETLGTEPTSEEIFYYIYAVLYSPSYRKRYEEFLKIDFPRIPLPSDVEKFKKLSELGKELVELHLLKHPLPDKTDIGFPKEGTNKVGKVRYDEKTKRVYFNKEQYFEGISKEVWEYKIGSCQPMEKYLKDRKGRELTLEEIEHYMKVANAIN